VEKLRYPRGVMQICCCL